MTRFAGWMAGAVTLSYSLAASAAETAEQGAEQSGGMPQLDPSTFGSQIFWLAVMFAALYWLMANKVVPAVEAVIEERNNRIQGDLDAAAKLRSEAEALYAKYEAELSMAHSRAQEAINSAKTHVTTTIGERTTALQSELDQKIDSTISELAASTNEALKNIDSMAAEAAAAAVERLIGVKVSAKEAKDAAAAVRTGI